MYIELESEGCVMAHFTAVCVVTDRLCGLVVRVLGYRFGGPGSIPGTIRFSDKKKGKQVVGLERGPLSLVSTTEELLDKKVVRIRHADHVAPFIRKS
jgi:hypothetical protein